MNVSESSLIKLRSIFKVIFTAGVCAVILGCARSAEDLYKDALAELEDNRPDIALERLEAAIEKDPTFVDPYKYLVRIYLNRENLEDAERVIKLWLEQEPYNSSARYELSRIYVRQGEFKRALELYNELIANAANVKERSQFENMKGFLEEAVDRQKRIDQLKKGLAEAPEDPRVNYELGAVYFEVGRSFTVGGKQETGANFLVQSQNLLEKARSLLEPATGETLDLASERILLASTVFELGQHYLLQRNSERAQEFFARAAKLNPGEAKFHFVLAQLHAREERMKEAIEKAKETIALAPDVDAYHDFLSRFLLKNEDAKGLRQMSERWPEKGHYLFSLAQLYNNQGKDMEEIVSLLDKAIEREPNSPRYRFSLAGFLGRQGKYDRSAEQLREVIRLGAGSQWEQLAHQMLARQQQETEELTETTE